MINRLLLCFVFLSILNFATAQYDDYMKVVAEPPTTDFIMYTDNDGNLFYINREGGYLDLMKYDVAEDKVKMIAENFVSSFREGSTEYNTGFGAIAPTKDRDVVYCMTTAGHNHGNADFYKLTCSEEKLEHITSACGTNYWQYWNMALDPNEKYLYYLGNNTQTDKAVYKVDIETKECSEILNVDNVIGARDLCFSGINVWDHQGNFYLPVWTYQQDDNDCALLKVHPEENDEWAELISFTDDMTEDGESLFPGFRHESCWNAISSSANGDIYIGVSNHYQPRDASQPHGNVAIYKYEPDNDVVKLLGDIKSVSESANNWIEHETQYKIHTFLIENSDGKIYGITGDHNPTYFLRGAHMYTIDINTDEIVDYSKTQTYLMNKDLEVIENGTEPSSTSGVFIEYYGIKGLSLNPNYPEYLYAMTWEMENGKYLQAYIIRYKIDGVMPTEIERIPVSTSEAMVYPNPVVENINFNLTSYTAQEYANLSVYDMNGRLVIQEKINTTNIYTLDMTNYNSQMYFYTIEIGNEVLKGKLMKY